MKIIPLSEGSFTVDKTKAFLPFDTVRDTLNDRGVGSLLVEIQPFVVVTSKDVLLIDTGLGFSVKNELQIHKNLQNNGIKPAQITKVLMSHLHKDHAGGIGFNDRLGNSSLSFSGAVYYVQRKELEYAFEAGFPSFMTEELNVLDGSSQVELIDGGGVIDDYIHYSVSGGHSPFHQVFRIEENGETIFFGGDVAPQFQQMKSKFVAKYDYDGRRSMQLRQEWWKKGQEENWKFLFYHDIKTPVWPAN